MLADGRRWINYLNTPDVEYVDSSYFVKLFAKLFSRFFDSLALHWLKRELKQLYSQASKTRYDWMASFFSINTK